MPDDGTPRRAIEDLAERMLIEDRYRDCSL
jgi:hypothetical protein